jgi:hypothetical protein
MSYGGPKVLDLAEKLTDKCIKDMIMDFDNMTAEEKLILLETYCQKYYEMIEHEDVRLGGRK